jgi:L-fuconolactonase
VLLELPAEFPNHLEDVPELARRHPGLSIVIDHLGKPPLGRESIRVWRRQLAAAAEHANVHAKVSGLGSGEGSSDPRTAIETAFESFGPDRLMFGSDWPMALLHGTYENLVGEMRDAIELIAGGDAEAVLAANALRLYRIGATALSKWDGT